jgi:ADP-L-glycero-D-manno-heptose 6-epimerase
MSRVLTIKGGADFVGSNLVHELNAYDVSEILAVDNLANARRFESLHGARYVDSTDKRGFRAILENAPVSAGVAT